MYWLIHTHIDLYNLVHACSVEMRIFLRVEACFSTDRIGCGHRSQFRFDRLQPRSQGQSSATYRRPLPLNWVNIRGQSRDFAAWHASLVSRQVCVKTWLNGFKRDIVLAWTSTVPEWSHIRRCLATTATSVKYTSTMSANNHWRRVSCEKYWRDKYQDIGGEKVVKADKCMGVSHLLGTRPGCPPKA